MMNYKITQPLCIYELGQRQRQEDSIYPAAATATTDSRFFIVCDGMGGHQAGDVASQCVCNTIGEYIDTEGLSPSAESAFEKALSAAYDRLDGCDSGDGTGRQMGTTLVMLALGDEGAMFAHIGDSRIYHIRPSQRAILYKSRDHSLVNNLYEVGEITLEEMKTHPRKNVITKAIQPNQEQRTKARIVHSKDICAGDYFYLCSDGMLEKMEDEEIVSIFCQEELSDEQRVEILINECVDNRDNHSAYIVKIAEVEGVLSHDDDSTAVVFNQPQEDENITKPPLSNDDITHPTPYPKEIRDSVRPSMSTPTPKSYVEKEEVAESAEERVSINIAPNHIENPSSIKIYTYIVYAILSVIIFILIALIVKNYYV